MKHSANSLAQIAVAIAQQRMAYFTRWTYPGYTAKWYHNQISQRLDALFDGTIRRLMIFVPPQHGKSELVSRRYPAYLLGRCPTLRIAGCSYSADLAQKFNREVQRIIESTEYQELFPHTKLAGQGIADGRTWQRNSDCFEVVGHGGQYNSVGVMGPLTGKSVDFGIIDDPVKDQLEAASSTYRSRVWEWYTDVFCTRLHNESRVLLTMTRWHEDDLAGRILASEGDKWAVLRLPAIKEDNDNAEDPRAIGDALWPEKHSADSILAAKSRSERTYASLYQQRPAPSEGGLFKRDWWRFWDRLPPMDRIITSWDCTFKESGSSYVVGQVWGKSGSNAYLIDQVRGKWDFPETANQVRDLRARYPQAREHVIEEKANGAAIIAFLRKEIPGMIAVNPTESKEARASAVSYVVESGNVYLPQDAPYKNELMHELSVFPNGANDDMVDSLGQALSRFYSRNPMRAGMAAI